MNAKSLTLPLILMVFTQLTYGQMKVGIGSDFIMSQIYFANNQLYYLGIDSIATNVYTVTSSEKFSFGYSPSIYFQHSISNNLIVEMGITQSFIKDKIKVNEYLEPNVNYYTPEEYATILNNYKEITESPIFPGFFYNNLDSIVNETNDLDIKLQTYNIPLSIIYTPRITPRSKLLFKTGLSAKLIVERRIDTELKFHLYNIEAEKAFKFFQSSFDLGLGYRFNFSDSQFIDIMFQSSRSLFPISNLKEFKPYEDLPSVHIPPIKRRSFGIQLKYFFGKI